MMHKKDTILTLFLAIVLVGAAVFAHEAYAQTTPRVSLSAHPSRIVAGRTSSLAYNATSDATSCTGSDGWSTYLGNSGTYIVSPKITTTYHYTCSGSGGSSSASVTVFVDPEPLYGSSSSAGSGYSGGYGYGYDSGVQLNISPNTISIGESATLIWSAPAYNTCHAAGGWSGTLFTSGTRRVAPVQTTTYDLICVGGSGAGSDSETLLVAGSPATPTTIVVPASSFTAACVASPVSTTPGRAVSFVASSAGGVSPVEYQWRGAVTGVGRMREVAFSDLGTQVTTVVATDAAGKTATASCSTTVANASSAQPQKPAPPASAGTAKPASSPKVTLTLDTEDEIAALCLAEGYAKPAAAELAAGGAIDGDGEKERKPFLASLIFGGGTMPPGLGLFLFMIALIAIVFLGTLAVYRFSLFRKKAVQEQELTKPM